MAHFYGTVEGKSGSVASRTGSKKSGLEVSAKSWAGEVVVALTHLDGQDFVTLFAGPHGAPNAVLFNGPVAELVQRTAQDNSAILEVA